MCNSRAHAGSAFNCVCSCLASRQRHAFAADVGARCRPGKNLFWLSLIFKELYAGTIRMLRSTACGECVSAPTEI